MNNIVSSSVELSVDPSGMSDTFSTLYCTFLATGFRTFKVAIEIFLCSTHTAGTPFSDGETKPIRATYCHQIKNCQSISHTILSSFAKICVWNVSQMTSNLVGVGSSLARL